MTELDKLIDEQGNCRYGVFDIAVREVNYRDFRLTTPFGKPVNGLRKRLAFNQFQFLGGVSDELLFGCAIVSTKLLATAFVYFFRPSDGKRVEFSFKAPLSMGIEFDQRPEEGNCSFTQGGNRFAMSGDVSGRRLEVTLKKGVTIDAHFSEVDPPVEPLRICTRSGPTGWVFVRKTAATAVRGKVVCPLGEFDLESIGMLGHNDWSAGYMRRETWWDWACFCGRLADGRTIALNASCGVNETSYTESCYWLDGALYPLGPVAFEYDRFNPKAPWSVRTTLDRTLDLSFTAAAEHTEKVNAFIAATNFHQYVGTFEGTIAAGNETLKIDKPYGYAENHYAKW